MDAQDATTADVQWMREKWQEVMAKTNGVSPQKVPRYILSVNHRTHRACTMLLAVDVLHNHLRYMFLLSYALHLISVRSEDQACCV